jgi:hypothetical protein
MASKVDLREVKVPNAGNLLHLAAARGQAEICRFLVEQSGLDVNGANPIGECRVASLILLTESSGVLLLTTEGLRVLHLYGV